LPLTQFGNSDARQAAIVTCQDIYSAIIARPM